MKKFAIVVIALFLMAMAMAPASAILEEKHIGKVPVGEHTVTTISQNTTTTCMVAAMSMVYKYYGKDDEGHGYSNIYAYAMGRPPYTGALYDADVTSYFVNNHFSTASAITVTPANANSVFDNYIMPRMNNGWPTVFCFYDGETLKHTWTIDGYVHNTTNNTDNKVWLHDPNYLLPQQEVKAYWQGIIQYSVNMGGNPTLWVLPGTTFT